MSAQVSDLMGLGMPGPLASALGANIRSITGVGTSQGGSSPIIYGGDTALLTVAATATAVTLDSSFPVGQSAIVVNLSTSVTGLLYPPTSGTINGGSANASMNIPAGAVVTVRRVSTTAFWAIIGQVALVNPQSTVTAFAGGGQTNATQLTGTMARVSTVASAADSVKLPLAEAGKTYFLRNNTGNAMQVFGAGTDTINDVATATGLSQGGAATAAYFCITSAPAGKWFRVLGA